MTDRTVHCMGIGLACGYGFGKSSALQGVLTGKNLFRPLEREGRQVAGNPPFIGIELPDSVPQVLSRRASRTTGLTGQVCAAVAAEAWQDAGFGDPGEHRLSGRTGVILGGSNLQSREMELIRNKLLNTSPNLAPPRLGHSFLDTDVAALISEELVLDGPIMSVGGASASGALAVHLAAAAIRSGELDICLVIGPLQDMSWLELQALRNLGAMGPHLSDESGDLMPEPRCRPFDAAGTGFLFGESAAALVLARSDLGPQSYGRISGLGRVQAQTRGPEPSQNALQEAITAALTDAGIPPSSLDFISAHATGTPRGDAAEAQALVAQLLNSVHVTAPKSALGHGVAAAGAVEIALAFLQMEAGQIAPIHGLVQPTLPDLNYVLDNPESGRFNSAMCLSSGFGGFNLATVLSSD
ncbi:beta-ketoacyl synthase N-terminal-like domain-containing protein [Labrenzia sp. PHM005]|uniref:beta-ketoacyl synthase N-terminal-like domain-containing protein n=1 Tax=Labrenzia sp. PHM005 TaxID=2590016 RepID=UPI00113FD99F|nr:beta-ketoacyl synthase N-terminal-like domain-containing protein [Labrenzia sp. PHM005]QDG75032.1 polyketide beta-ketoacyl:ACP synthase [Labrenzia sp. PHM005]